MMPNLWIRCFFLVFLLNCSTTQSAQGITVFAAASTADYMTQLASEFQAQTGHRVRFSFAASSTLSRQIEAGADADLFVSANPQWANQLKQRLPHLPQPESYLGNRMVLISCPEQDLPSSIQAWQFEGTRVAIGNPQHVPAGQYAKRGLVELNLWEDVVPFLVPTSSVREALRLVSTGECEWGLVYESDAAVSKLQSIGLPLPDGERIEYQILRTGKEPNIAVDRFADFLFSSFAEALAIRMNFQWPQSLK